MRVSEKKKQVTISFRANKDERDIFYEVCKEEGVSPSEVLRYMVKAYAKKTKTITVRNDADIKK